MFLPQETGASGNLKRIAKAMPKFKIHTFQIFTQNISPACNPIQTCINFVEQQLKMFHFEGRYKSLI